MSAASGRRPVPPAVAVMGVVNVTPDSFSDGGAFLDPVRAVEHGVRLVEEGAHLLDVGAESTRPGAAPVPPEIEQERLLPVLARLRPLVDVPLSVDTRNAATARAALDLGADMINDVSGLRCDPELARAVAESGAGLVLMHSRGTPADMQRRPAYGDVVSEVGDELDASRETAEAAGCRPEAIVLDPGIGFAKAAEHNLELMRRLPELVERWAPTPVLVGVSRKSIIGHLLAAPGGAPRAVGDRLHGSLGAALAAVAGGAHALRVHDVRATVDALRTFRAAAPEPCSGAA